jgi:hypothetical protein
MRCFLLARASIDLLPLSLLFLALGNFLFFIHEKSITKLYGKTNPVR